MDLIREPALTAVRGKGGSPEFGALREDEKPNGRLSAALLLPLRECTVITGLQVPAGSKRQVSEAIRLRIASTLRRDPENVLAGWARVPSGVVACGAPLAVVRNATEKAEKAGLRVVAVEPAVLGLLRAVCNGEGGTVVVCRLAGEEVELVAGSGQDVLLCRRFSWSTAEGLALEIEQTLQTLDGAEGTPRPSGVLICGDVPPERVASTLAGRLDVPVKPAMPHPSWNLADVPSTHLAAVGGLLPGLGVNLLPRRSPVEVLPAVASWGALATAAAAAALITLSASGERARLSSELRIVREEVQILEGRVAELRQRAAVADAVRRVLEATRAQEVPHWLGPRLEDTIPEGVWLTSLSLGPQEVRITGFSLGWPAVDRWVDELRKGGLAVQLRSVGTEGTRYYRFTMTVRPGVRGPR